MRVDPSPAADLRGGGALDVGVPGVEIDAWLDPFYSRLIAVKIGPIADRKKPESSESLIANGQLVERLMKERFCVVQIEILVNHTNIPSAI